MQNKSVSKTLWEKRYRNEICYCVPQMSSEKWDRPVFLTQEYFHILIRYED